MRQISDENRALAEKSQFIEREAGGLQVRYEQSHEREEKLLAEIDMLNRQINEMTMNLE